jgi:zinc/manganese transport system ATP-binding protein
MESEKILELSRIYVRFKDRIVLNEIDIEVKAGEFIGMIGPNGAGKTTLLRVILGLLTPSGGSVTISGKPIRHGNRAVGYVPQKIQLDPDIPLRGRDLVGLGIDGHRWGIPLPRRARQQQIDEVLGAVDALRFADSPVGKLSGGEQQRLLIAQALLTNPKILLLDEPLSNLDIRSAHEIISLVSKISKEKGIAVILVAHDMNPLLGVMDKILYLAQGHAVMGSVDDVIQNEVLTRLYGYDVEVLRIRGRILVVGGTNSEHHDVLDLAGGSHCSGEEVMTY